MKAKTILYGLAGSFVLIQFLPINKTLPPTEEALEFHTVQNPPGEIYSLLKNACYDCHSNHTRYPWYTHVQPVGWWVQNHVKSGRAELNFSEFGEWSAFERAEVLDQCALMIEKGAMPLRSYLPMHPEARLSDGDKKLLINWLRNPASFGKVVKIAAAAPPDTCDDNDANPRCCFRDMPDSLTAIMKIAGKDEPGERIAISGRMLNPDGKTPCAGVLLYAYHTDATGRYSPKGGEKGIQKKHGYLHGWCRSDREGRYEIHSIHPASYPDSRIEAHIHAVVWEPGGKEPYFINEFVFDDDPFVNARYRAVEMKKGKESSVVKLRKDPEGVWVGERDIVLKH